MNPEFMSDLFVEKSVTYNFRLGDSLSLPAKSTGTNTLVFRAYQAWNKLPKALKQASSLKEFATGINSISQIYCLCKVCA